MIEFPEKCKVSAQSVRLKDALFHIPNDELDHIINRQLANEISQFLVKGGIGVEVHETEHTVEYRMEMYVFTRDQLMTTVKRMAGQYNTFYQSRGQGEYA